MEEILKAIMQAQAQAQQQQAGQRTQRQSADPLAEMLGGLIGGQQQAQSRQQQQAANPMQQILGGILGAQSGIPRQQAQRAAQDPLAEILGAAMGSGTSGGGLADLIGMVMGGGNVGRRSASNPIANMIAGKFGVSPMIANMIVNFFMAKMLSGKLGGMTQSGAGQYAPSQQQQSNGLDLDDLLGMLKGGGDIGGVLNQSGFAKEMAEATGVDEGTAVKSVTEILKALSGARSRPTPVKPQQNGLNDLLDTW